MSRSGLGTGRKDGLPPWAADLVGLVAGTAEETAAAHGLRVAVQQTGLGRDRTDSRRARVVRVRVLAPTTLELTVAEESPPCVRGERP